VFTVLSNSVTQADRKTLWTEESEVSEMPIDLDILDKLKARVQLARKIDSAQHKVKKENHDRNWMRKTAEAMEILLDSDFARYLRSHCHCPRILNACF
jgi:ATP-dependent RNA helicase DDX24/MAK5